MVCPHGQRGLNQCGHFSKKGEGSIFHDFVKTSFMDGHLLEFNVMLKFLSIKSNFQMVNFMLRARRTFTDKSRTTRT